MNTFFQSPSEFSNPEHPRTLPQCCKKIPGQLDLNLTNYFWIRWDALGIAGILTDFQTLSVHAQNQLEA